MAEEQNPQSPVTHKVELTETIRLKDGVEIVVQVPPKIAAASSGDYVLQEAQRQQPEAQIPAVVGSTVSFFAVEAQKQKIRLKRVTLKIAWPPELSIEWERE